MSKFLRDLLLLVGILLGINFLLWQAINNIYLTPYATSTTSTPITTLLLADSHGAALGSFSEDCPVFNASSAGDSYYDMHSKLQWFIDNNRPTTLLIQADKHLLSSYRDQNNNQDRSSYFRTTKNARENISMMLFRYISLLNPKHRDVLVQYMKRKFHYPAEISTSTSWASLSPDKKQMHVIERLHVHFPKNAPISQMQDSELSQLLILAEAHQISVYGVVFPTSKTYDEQAPDTYSPTETFKRSRLTLLNPIFFSDDLFEDPDHLNDSGAKLFRDSLCTKISAPTK